MHFTKEVTDNLSVLKFLIDFKWNGTCAVILKDHHNFLRFNQDSRMKVKNIYTRQSYLFGFLLITILLPVFTMSVPIHGKRSSDQSSGSTETPKWVNPCPGVPTGSAERRSSAEDESTGSDSDYINSILLTAKQAQYQAETFKDNYVLKTFNVQLKAHHVYWQKVSYDWLRKDSKIPKELGEKTNRTVIESVEMVGEVVRIYGFLQRLAVALEQVIDDHHDMNSEFKEEFKLLDENLKNMLCELREIVPESQLALFDNTDRKLMVPEFRHMQNLTHRHVRDWLIFRDYLNLVEYLIELMTYFKEKTV